MEENWTEGGVGSTAGRSALLSPRELAYCGVCGAAALLLPPIFHLLHLGRVFMPMYLPLMTLPFFVGPVPAAITAALTPLISGTVTGMPPFYPPVAAFMAMELAAMAAAIAAAVRRWPRVNEWALLVPVLLAGRAFHVGLVYLFSLAIALPASFMAGLSLLSGWPGLALMIAVIPPIARTHRAFGGPRRKEAKLSACAGENPRVAFFDGLADTWDAGVDLEALAFELAAGLEEIGLGPDETVLDIGCGTGNLTRALLQRLSPAGRVVAVDISPRMIEAARKKIADPRVDWRVADARRLPLSDRSFDRVVCFAVWPHFDDPGSIARELARVLRPGGLLHIWHLVPRERVNQIHAEAGGPVRGDFLAPADETAKVLEAAGFQIVKSIDDSARYLITAVRPGG